MPALPRERTFDSSLALLREGYAFIGNRCNRHRSPVFATRLLLQPTLCLRGEAAARLFYESDAICRAGAAPRLLQKTLLGSGGVQGLDGPRHRVRKALFLGILSPGQVAELARLSEAHWLAAAQRWQGLPQVQLLTAVEELLCRSVCEWAGVPLTEDEVEPLRQDFASMIDGAGRVGWRHIASRIARKRSERWAAGRIREFREGRRPAPPESALAQVSRHSEDGAPLPEDIAAVELLNLLRPTVAVARFIVFAALELHRDPAWKQRLDQSEALREAFANEVRRLYAFFPFTAARLTRDLDWNGYRLPAGSRLLLDLFGTSRDPATWREPEQFDPERFMAGAADRYQSIPQGGGDPAVHHRCPGERTAQELLKVALRMLCGRIDYQVPQQDLSVDLTRMPMLPTSRFEIGAVRLRPAAAAAQA